MKKIKLNEGFIILLFLMSFGLQGCFLGTETGNPILAAPAIDENNPPDFSGVFELSCDLISFCNSQVTKDNCVVDILTLDNIDEEIGLIPGDYNSLTEILEAYGEGILTPDTVAVDTCARDIVSLSCSDQLVIDAYDESRDHPYEGLAAMLPDSCSTIY